MPTSWQANLWIGLHVGSRVSRMSTHPNGSLPACDSLCLAWEACVAACRMDHAGLGGQHSCCSQRASSAQALWQRDQHFLLVKGLLRDNTDS
ncbi:hypothetical protein WJX72_004860 [[Myrmecia] bisecta]|uniref:Uncharacterized protein n=1 Tax=[Myrmecia] bisecta TaxID=41462 RepID=A0AAW1QQK9_9CHLO